jgi:dihydroorotase
MIISGRYLGNENFLGDIEIANGEIVALTPRALEPEEHTFGPSTVLRERIADEHVHIRAQRLKRKARWSDFAANAFQGGVGAVMDMPNNNPPTLTLDDVALRRNLASAYVQHTDIFTHVMVTPRTKPFGEFYHYKLFVAESSGGQGFSSENDLRRALDLYSGCHIMFHCEDPSILAANTRAPLHEDRRPREAEVSAIGSVLDLCQEYGIHATIAHVSTMKGLRMILDAKPKFETLGLRLRSQVVYHHLLLNRENLASGTIEVFGQNYELEHARLIRMNPPIREESDQTYLMQRLIQGDIDAVASDDAPHTLAEKQSSSPPSGVTILPFEAQAAELLHSFGVTNDILTHVTHDSPMQYMTRDWHYKSDLYEGRSAKFIVVDRNKGAIADKDVPGKPHWCYLSGALMPGKVTHWIDGDNVIPVKIS